MKLRALRFGKWVSFIVLSLILAINGYYIGISMQNIIRDNGANLVDFQHIDAKLEIESSVVPSLSFNLTDAFSTNQTAMTNSTDLFRNINASLFSYNESGVVLNGIFYDFNTTFTLESFISGIRLKIGIPMTFNNSGFYDIDQTAIALSISNATTNFKFGSISIPRLPQHSTQSFAINFTIPFTSPQSFTQFSETLKNPQSIHFSLSTTIFFFFPVRITIHNNVTSGGM